MARLVVDEAPPRSVARELRGAGHDAADIRDIGLRGQPDEAIFLEAQQRAAILVTSDLGFTNVFRFPPWSHRGLIIVRLPNGLPTAQVAEAVVRSIREAPLAALAGSVVIVEPTRTRIRRF